MKRLNVMGYLPQLWDKTDLKYLSCFWDQRAQTNRLTKKKKEKLHAQNKLYWYYTIEKTNYYKQLY